MERWIQLHRYDSLHNSEEAEVADSLQVRLRGWLALRKVRNTLFAGALILLSIVSIHYIDLTAISRAVRPVTHQPTSETSPNINDQVDWRNFAYVQYVTNENYLCNALMILEALHGSGSKADRMMMYPDNWHVTLNVENESNMASKLLGQARDLYQTKLVPIKVQTSAKGDTTWKDSFTKLLAFNQTQYKRLISLDSDATVRKLILLEPSTFEWRRIQNFIDKKDSGFDMDILNTIYKDSCVVLPHRRYNLISGEFRGGRESHTKYLGSDEEWDGTKMLEEAKFVHFSDWPVPKPWVKASDSVMAAHQPQCKEGKEGRESDCNDRDIWLNLYKDFSERRQRICGRAYDKRDITQRESSHLIEPPKYEPIFN
ncbi:hypothetical protein N0V90_001510 [Kalmusia sp. IMI 367209]|nr:hypothetical protein N0V90_001510 [Kalmusia sp. IMI 367209]